ncbi:ABC transporter permease [Leucobacter allii]|uniref:ABC transporter permease n=1 Tax=Leucobacter allii TaxID=2932247 RepID=A0ABY4FK62_9MICO|nr:ABC transporter permease [Leucobacter allii]UOQ56652.1 ABC transporter permease [Leucobacter allii]UOR01086.1 ABC transporter permease [Leucobacter allii]
MDILLAGLVGGSAYALIAVGVSLVFGVSNIVNFAHGAVFAIGAMLSWWLSGPAGLPIWLVAPAVIAITGLLGWAVYLLAVRPLRRAPGIAVLLATFAVGVILDNLSLKIFGAQTRRLESAFPRDNFELFGFRFGTLSLVIIGVSLVCVAALAWLLGRTKTGRAIRATSQDQEAAQQMGIPVERIQALSFVIASALGGIAGLLVGMYTSNVSPGMGFLAGLQGFAAATIGGLGSIAGAVIGGLLLGVAEALGVSLWGDSVRQLITFGSLLLVLWIRPGGLLGRVPSIASEPMTGTFFGAGKPLRLPPWLGVAAAAVLALLPLIASDYFLRAGSQVWIYALFALSITLAGGFAGQIVLGQAGALAIGAYTSAILVTRYDWGFWPSFLAAGLAAGVLQVILTAPTWRLRGHYVSMATLAAGAFVAALALNLPELTAGSRGISAIPRPELFGVRLGSADSMYWLTLGLLLVGVVLVLRLGSSRLGRVWAAVREDEVAAASAGLHPASYKSLAFGLGSVLAGFAGALYAVQVTFIEPKQFDVSLSVLAVTIAILGGLRTPLGAIVGAAVLVGVPELFRPLADWRLLLYGVLLLALILLRPQGVWADSPWLRERWARLRGRPSERDPVHVGDAAAGGSDSAVVAGGER